MKSIIYVTSRRLLPLNSGDKVLTFNILKRLAKIYNIYLYNLNEGSEYTKDEILTINEICMSFKTVQFDNSHSLFKILKTLFYNKMYLKVKTYNKQIEKDLTDFLNLDLNAEYIVWDHLRSSLFFSSNKFKNILIEHNNEADILFERAEKTRIPFVKYLIKKQAKFLKAYVENIHTKMDRIIYLNKNDFLYFVEKEPKKYILMDKLLIDFEHRPYEPKKNIEKINLLFVGSLDWYPNIDAIHWFLEEVFPYLRNKNNYHLDIVGRDPSKTFIKTIKKYSNVGLHRNVPSVEEYYLQADIVLMPIRRGSGINIKVLEALSYGIPMVMTSFAKRGYQGLDFIPSADDAESFAKSINQLANIKNRKELSVQELMYYDDYQKNTNRVIKNLFDTF